MNVHGSPKSERSNAYVHGSPKSEKSNAFFGILSSNPRTKKRSMSQPRSSTITKSPIEMKTEKTKSSAASEINNVKKKNPSGESLLRRSLWASRSKIRDSCGNEYKEMNNKNATTDQEKCHSNELMGTDNNEANVDSDDVVSGFLYDKLQKEVISLRKFCEVKNSTLDAKEDEIKVPS